MAKGPLVNPGSINKKAIGPHLLLGVRISLSSHRSVTWDTMPQTESETIGPSDSLSAIEG
jgi:hypothetical protein